MIPGRGFSILYGRVCLLIALLLCDAVLVTRYVCFTNFVNWHAVSDQAENCLTRSLVLEAEKTHSRGMPYACPPLKQGTTLMHPCNHPVSTSGPCFEFSHHIHHQSLDHGVCYVCSDPDFLVWFIVSSHILKSKQRGTPKLQSHACTGMLIHCIRRGRHASIYPHPHEPHTYSHPYPYPMSV